MQRDRGSKNERVRIEDKNQYQKKLGKQEATEKRKNRRKDLNAKGREVMRGKRSLDELKQNRITSRENNRRRTQSKE